MTVSAAPLTLWLTDRSRYKLGTGRCARARYLGYHAGPTGYGITTRSDSLPLATGLSAHGGLAEFMAILKAGDRLPTLDETRGIIAAVRRAYEARVEARGFRSGDLLSSAVTAEIILEQSALISGLLWAVRLKFLPWFHEQYRVVVCEQERLHFLTCTCGAHPLQPADHIARGCQGQTLMIRTDIMAQRRGAQTLAYFEAKTTGWESDAWAEQWETDPQLAMGTLDAQQIWGAEVTELFILGLGKGTRRREKVDAGEEPGRKKQMSALCYGYCRPSNPPLAADDWLPAYEWINDAGEVKRASRAHRRRGVWELPESDWPTWRAYAAQDPAMTPEEFWVRMLPPSVLDKVCFLIGPLNRQDAQLHSLRGSLIGEETRWQAILWELYEAQEGGPDRPPLIWPDLQFQAVLDRLVPCSWQCRPFGKEHQCEFVPICHRHEGWQDPIASGRYQPRLPHHAPELQQAIARGLLPADAAEREEEEER